MKQKKILRKVVSLFLIIIFTLSPYGDSGIVIKKHEKVVKAANSGYAIYEGNTKLGNGIDLDLTGTKGIRIAPIDSTDPSTQSMEILRWNFATYSPGGVAYAKINDNNIMGTGADPKQLVIIPTHPGIETIIVTYKMANGLEDDLSCKVRVPISFQRSDVTNIPQIAETDKKNPLVLDVDGYTSTPEGDKFPKSYTMQSSIPGVKFSGIYNENGCNATLNDLQWTSTKHEIAEVDNKGVITAKGPGLTTITASAGEGISDTIDVLVLPRFYSSERCNDPLITDESNPEKFILNEDTDKTLYSHTINTKYYLDYDFYEMSDIKAVEGTTNEPKKSDKIIVDKSAVDGKLKIMHTSKAGRYLMKTYAMNYLTNRRASWIRENELEQRGYPNKLYFDIPLYINHMVQGSSDNKIHMNKNDTFNLYENSNVQDISDFYVDYNNVDWADRMEYNETTGDFKALKEGSYECVISPKSSVSDKYPGDASKKIFKCTIEVSNGMSLNMSDTKIPIGTNVLKLWVVDNDSDVITWKSDKPGIAKVDQYGNVSGISQGDAVISASALENGVRKTAICKVRVYNTLSAIELAPKELSVFVNDSAYVSATYVPNSVSDVDIKWISLDDKIAKVEQESNKRANVIGVKAGETLVMAVSTSNIVLGTCKVTVKEIITDILLSETSVEVPLSQKTYTITATVKPSTASTKDIVWGSTEEKVATVKDGKLTLLSAGETIISASAPGTTAQTKYCKVKVTQSVTGLTLASTEKVVYMGETSTIGYSVLPITAGNKKVTWSSTKTTIATVNSATGLITPVSVGETTIIARTVEGNFMQTCTVYVKEKAKGISIDLRDVVVQVGEEYKIPYTLNPVSSTEADITWTSTNTTVATVSNKGVVKGIIKGSTIIMAKLANGEIAYCNVVVQEKVTGLQLNFTKKTIYKGKTFTLKATVEPNEATNPQVTFTSSNEKVATVSAKGKVTGKKAGTTIITVKTKEKGFVEYCVVTVKQNVTSIKLNHTSYTLGLKKSVTLVAKVTTTASNKKLKWTSSNPTVATVSSSGKVTAKKYGKTTITAAAQDGSGKKATCTIQVVRLVTKVKLNKYSMTIVAGRKASLKATVTPKNATYKGVKWSSSDKTIATVSSGGTVYALQTGIVYITAKAKDSSKKSAVCRVEVKQAVSASNITIITDDVVLSVNQSKIMPKSVTPPTSTDSVTWSSDNEYVATVNKATGKVTGKHPGICTISAYTTSGKSDTATVTVLGISRTKLTLEQYSEHKLYLEGITKGVTWESTNLSVATVDSSGNVVAIRKGTADIIATYRGTKFRCKVKVNKIR